MTSCYFRILLLLLPAVGASQIADQVVVQPALNIAWETDSRWSFNTTVSQRTQAANGYESLHVQVAQFALYEVGFYSQIGLGVMYRELFDDQLPEELRLTEQYVFARTFNELKIAHRLRWDQRIRDQRNITHRWRYRLSASIPLSGNNVDVSEFYLSGSAETLFVAENNRSPQWDQRLELGLGRQLGTNFKLQLSTEYRWEAWNVNLDKRLFFYVTLYSRL